MIEKLTPEQEDLMLVNDKKWWEIMYSTEPIDRQKAAEAVKQAVRIQVGNSGMRSGRAKSQEWAEIAS
ncbi:hypothetical protein QT979_28055, partial [Microcoleus sp. w2-18bC1]